MGIPLIPQESEARHLPIPLVIQQGSSNEARHLPVLHAEATNTFVREAIGQLGYPDRLQKLLLSPAREVSVELVLHKENGDIEVRGEDSSRASCT
jgi:hypothetical protein